MKKFSLLFLLTIVLSGMIFAQTITITHPITGETVVKGAAYTVQWTKSGTMAATVKIRLWNSTNTTKILNIVDSTANNGSYLCAASMFNGVPAGNYVIRVKTTDNAVVGVSGVFHLADAPTPGTVIGVTSPNGTDKWCKNHSYTIQWTHSGTLAPNVKIRLFDSAGTTKILNIINSTPNDGSYSWTIPNSIASASYRIKVKTTDNAAEDLSAVFKIISCASSVTPCSPFMVFKPQKNGIGIIGHNLEIKWGDLMLLMKKKNENDASNGLDSIKKAGIIKKLKMVKIEIKNVKCPASTPIAIEKVRSKYVMQKVPAKSIAELMKKPWVVNFSQWKTIKSSTLDDGYYSWPIPKTFKKGCYVIRVTRLWCDSNDKNRTATSQVFRLIPFSIEPTIEIRK